MSWLLDILGAVAIFLGIIVNLQVHFREASLYNTPLILGLLAGGLGLIARSLCPSAAPAPPGTDSGRRLT